MLVVSSGNIGTAKEEQRRDLTVFKDEVRLLWKISMGCLKMNWKMYSCVDCEVGQGY